MHLDVCVAGESNHLTAVSQEAAVTAGCSFSLMMNDDEKQGQCEALNEAA